MTQQREKEISDTLDHLMLCEVVEGARFEALLAIVEALAAKGGLEKFDGLSLRSWIKKESQERVARKMIMLEDAHPGAAARLQKILDEKYGASNGT